MIIRELLAEGKARLSAAKSSSCNIDTPALDAALLLSEVMCYSKEKLTANGGEPVSSAECGQFHSLLDRRLNGECIAYILGRKEFMGLEFSVNPQVLVPRPETEILVETALNAGDAIYAKTQNIKVLDLCTGSGAIAVSLKSTRTNWEVWASDISARALETAKMNAKRLLRNTYNINFIESDLLNSIPLSFNIIVSNPPYVPSPMIEKLPPEVKREPLLALDGGNDGLDLVRRIAEDAPLHLNAGGHLIMEAAPEQMETIAGIFSSRGFTSITVVKDLSGSERIIRATKKP